jgi:hypothetical protein
LHFELRAREPKHCKMETDSPIVGTTAYFEITADQIPYRTTLGAVRLRAYDPKKD